ncbi:MAG: DUF3120 domain-containing protein [Gloeocapsa sp. DLM2.Bin57]|nr:MAG: DUF3120 domain-containing protein [Gloeocapsa sp. DLM2.Bin57]
MINQTLINNPVKLLLRWCSTWSMFWGAGFLVSVPVFVQAPLVRYYPEFTLLLTLGWLWLAHYLYSNQQNKIWGDLLFGFSWSWLTGSIYWGWLRYEPLVHIPIESLMLPLALWCLGRGIGKIGNYFYLGSLLGTAITDLYFYINDLIPYWRQIMVTDTALVSPILQQAIAQVATPWGISWAVVLANFLLGVSLWAMQKNQLHWWAFAGAVLCTILVDALFWVGAAFV